MSKFQQLGEQFKRERQETTDDVQETDSDRVHEESNFNRRNKVGSRIENNIGNILSGQNERYTTGARQLYQAARDSMGIDDKKNKIRERLKKSENLSDQEVGEVMRGLEDIDSDKRLETFIEQKSLEDKLTEEELDVIYSDREIKKLRDIESSVETREDKEDIINQDRSILPTNEDGSVNWDEYMKEGGTVMRREPKEEYDNLFDMMTSKAYDFQRSLGEALYPDETREQLNFLNKFGTIRRSSFNESFGSDVYGSPSAFSPMEVITGLDKDHLEMLNQRDDFNSEELENNLFRLPLGKKERVIGGPFMESYKIQMEIARLPLEGIPTAASHILGEPASALGAMRRSFKRARDKDLDKIFDRTDKEDYIQYNFPIDQRRLGYDDAEFRGAGHEVLTRINEGEPYMAAVLGTFGNRTLNTTIGVKWGQAASGLGKKALSNLTKNLAKDVGTSAKKIKAWEELGYPGNKQEADAAVKKIADRISEGKAIGSKEASDYINNTIYKDILKEGKALPTKDDISRVLKSDKAMKLMNKGVNKAEFKTELLKNKPDEIEFESWERMVNNLDSPFGVIGPNYKDKGLDELIQKSKDDSLITQVLTPNPKGEGLLPAGNLPKSASSYDRIIEGGKSSDIIAAQSLSEKYGKNVANEVFGRGGAKALKDVKRDGPTDEIIKKYTEKGVAKKREYATQREIVENKMRQNDMDMVYPEGGDSVLEVTPDSFKVPESSPLRIETEKLKSAKNLLEKTSKKANPEKYKQIQKQVQEKQKLVKENADRLGIATKPDGTPYMDDNGFYASKKFQEHQFENYDPITADAYSAAFRQDALMPESGTMGPITKRLAHASAKTVELKDRTVDEAIINLKSVLDETGVSQSPESGKKIFKALTNVKRKSPDEPFYKSIKELRQNYPDLDDVSDGQLKVAKNIYEQMRDMRDIVNKSRIERGDSAVGWVEDYAPKMLKDLSKMKEAVGHSKHKAFENPDMIDIGKITNKHAKKRLSEKYGEELEDNAFYLFQKYMDSMASDLYMSPHYKTAKQNLEVLKDKGLDKTVNFWEKHYNHLAGDVGGIDKALNLAEGDMRKSVMDKIIDVRHTAALAINPQFNLLKQPMSHLMFTTKETGVSNLLKGSFKWLTDKERKSEILQSTTAHLKGAKGADPIKRSAISNYGKKIGKTKFESMRDVSNLITESIERNLTGMAMSSVKEQALSMGMTGEEASLYSQMVGGKSQSLYNKAFRPNMFENRSVKLLTPFQDFSTQLYDQIGSILGKRSMPRPAKARMKQGVDLVVGTVMSNIVYKAATGRGLNTPGDVVPFAGEFVDRTIDNTFGTEFAFRSGGIPSGMQELHEGAMVAKNTIGDARDAMTKYETESGKEIASALVKYALEPNTFDGFRDTLVKYSPALVGFGGGHALNRVIDTSIIAHRGAALDENNREMYDFDGLADIGLSSLFGPSSSLSAREYYDRMDSLTEERRQSMETRDNKKLVAEGRAEKLKQWVESGEMSETEFLKYMQKVHKQDPQFSEMIMDNYKSEKLTAFENSLKNMNVEDGSRYREALKYVKSEFGEGEENIRKGIFNLLQKGVLSERDLEYLFKEQTGQFDESIPDSPEDFLDGLDLEGDSQLD